MTIDLAEISHATTVQALAYAMDYHTNHYSPTYPPHTYHDYDHSEHIEVLASWGYQGYYFIQSRIKLTVLYGLIADWTDEIAMRGWIFWRNPITGTWHVEVESEETSVHHWQEAHHYHKQEETQMALKRARIDTYYPATHKADVTIYPLPGEPLAGVPLAEEIPSYLAAQLPDCTIGIFYDVEPPIPQITAIFRTNALAYNLPFGYNDRYFEHDLDLNSPGGNPQKSLSPVPPGEVWILQAFFAANLDRQLRIQCQIVNSLDEAMEIRDEQSDSTSLALTVTGEWVMKEGDYCRFIFIANQANDNLYWKAWGYKMKV